MSCYGQPRSIFDYIPPSEHAAIISRVSTYDCYDAIMNALADIPEGSLGMIWFPVGGVYQCSQTVHIKRQVALTSFSTGLAHTYSTQIMFPPDVAGLDFHTDLTNADDPDPRFLSGLSDGSMVQGLEIVGNLGTDPAAHGIRLRARAVLERSTAWLFAGNGCHIECSVVEPEPGTYGNANNFRIQGCSFRENKGHGLYANGADANAGYVEASNSDANGGWGFYDSSFLGNTYIGCHTSDNALGAYHSDNANARNLFLGCYTEGGQLSRLMSPAIAIGDMIGELTSDSTGAVIGAMNNGGALFTGSLWTGDDHVMTKVGGDVSLRQLLSFQHEGGIAKRLKFDEATGDIYADDGNAGSAKAFTWTSADTDIGSGGGRPNPVPYAFATDRLLVGGPGANYRRIVYMPAAPTSGEWGRGDTIIHSEPSAGGIEGWRCVVGGTAGVDAVFKEYGTIAA